MTDHTSEKKVPEKDPEFSSGTHASAKEDLFEELSRETCEAWKELQVEKDDSSSDPSAEKENNTPGKKRPVKVFCHKCSQKLDVTNLRPFSMIRCPACGEKLLVPKWFDTYLLEEPGGSGGMAQVYRALDITLDREVAIKILKDGIRHDSVQAKRFLKEAKTAAALNHSNVIPIYTCGIYEGQTYLVMQYMGGSSLETRLNLSKGYFLDLQEVLHWFHDTAEGLEHAASRSIVHHDVKPGNILMDTNGNVRIGDFGLAQSAANQEDSSEVPDEEWITPNYVSPERVESGREDFRGDIYSLGATFYHLLTGKVPFEHENLEELIWMRTRQKPPSPAIHRPEIPQAVSTLIMRMMEIDPAARPSYRQIITTLEEVLNTGNDGPVVLQRDFPLPKVPEEGSAFHLEAGTASSIYRVKSPSAVLKSRKEYEGTLSPVRKNHPCAVQDQPSPGDVLQNRKNIFRKKIAIGKGNIKNILLWSGVLLLTVLTFSFLVYASVELFMAGL